MNTQQEKRTEAVNTLVSKHFTLYSPLQWIDGRFVNKELTVYDCLFFLRLVTPLNIFECDSINGLRKLN